VLHFQVFWVLHAADAVGNHEAADPLRVLHRVVQPTDPAGRCRHHVEAIKAQMMHQAVQVIAHGARLLSCQVRPRAAPVPPVIGNATVARRGEHRELVHPALAGA
jgi:hypothetical protein